MRMVAAVGSGGATVTGTNSGTPAGSANITCLHGLGAETPRSFIHRWADIQLVAPVKVDRGAMLGAGTTLTRDARPDQLMISRAKNSIAGWKRPVKQAKAK